MTQKKSCSLSTNANRHFYKMAKIHVVIMKNVNIFIIHETFFPKCNKSFTDNLPKQKLNAWKK